MKQDYTEPVYGISIAAKFLKVCPDTLRIWERRGLIKPSRLGKNRFYSKCDIERLESIKDLIQRKRINIQGVINILSVNPCWELKKCKPDVRNACLVYKKQARA
ncbi:MAG: MerR family transcriptional regulator [Candidatus Omnitrophica bacterium]|nr:MerR family transcriptional regulator [Candidatus Omnitrophota bacterium]